MEEREGAAEEAERIIEKYAERLFEVEAFDDAFLEGIALGKGRDERTRSYLSVKLAKRILELRKERKESEKINPEKGRGETEESRSS